jgi:arsenate reductase (thioredoxin)
MAEAWLNHFCGDKFEAESAGIEPGRLNPIVVQAMAEVGIDISKNATKSALDLFKAGRLYQHVIAVCDKEAAEKCPVFPGVVSRLHWSFPDPSSFSGSDSEKLARTREIRDLIRDQVQRWSTSLSDLSRHGSR